jgi:hypothetical protein
MSEIKGNGKTGNTIRSKPFFSKPDVGPKYEVSPLQFAVELFDTSFQLGAANLNWEIA